MEQKTNLWQKLLSIQKSVKTFDVGEDSEKSEPNGKSSYKYTPGWMIVETIREKMDELSLMLIQNVRNRNSQLIEYPVYKLVDGKPAAFQKKEIYIELDVDFTWVDASTGETFGPLTMSSAGANGTDKSISSALALAERYFLLKFFRITTREKNDEPDAHDCDYVPGIPKERQAPMQQNASYPAQQPAQPMMPYGPSPAPDYASMAPPSYGQTQVQGYGFSAKDPNITNAVLRLVNFNIGTPSHSQMLNEVVGQLAAQGYNCAEPHFLENLTESAQAMRENRRPVLK